MSTTAEDILQALIDVVEGFYGKKIEDATDASPDERQAVQDGRALIDRLHDGRGRESLEFAPGADHAPTIKLARHFRPGGRGRPIGWIASTGHTEGSIYEMTAVGETKKAAVKALLSSLATLVGRAEKHRYLFTADGTVLIVRATLKGFCYEIADATRAVTCGCHMAGDFQTVLTAARKHAEAYGGITGECQ